MWLLSKEYLYYSGNPESWMYATTIFFPIILSILLTSMKKLLPVVIIPAILQFSFFILYGEDLTVPMISIVWSSACALAVLLFSHLNSKTSTKLSFFIVFLMQFDMFVMIFGLFGVMGVSHAYTDGVMGMLARSLAYIFPFIVGVMYVLPIVICILITRAKQSKILWIAIVPAVLQCLIFTVFPLYLIQLIPTLIIVSVTYLYVFVIKKLKRKKRNR